ncbi:MAG: 30S ribosomal protein S16 [Verrucomicrobiota bacterium]
MALSIRLRRDGTKNSPYYRVVVTEGRSKRDGKFVELVGTYDPKKAGTNYTLKSDRIAYWMKVGAKPSETVASMIKRTAKAK